jgi:5,10-methylene-tetrahydrofolate dehydrogenase/methenyl tetrahydrofolate cyclohydrolase
VTATVLDPSPIAAEYLAEVSRDVARLTDGGRRLRILGLLGQQVGPAATYARYARRGCDAVGVDLDVRLLDADQVEAAIAAANVDPEVDGVFLYYPLMDRSGDRWLRELVDPRKDVEGLHSFWSRLLYENERFVDPEHTVRAILPCTPLAILKLLDHAGIGPASAGSSNAPLENLTACVINRSELVGRPLAAMLANDGARVHSLDITGAVTFEPAIGRRTHDVHDSGIDRATALATADIIISAVPSKTFELVRGDEIREGAICVDVAEYTNFDKSVLHRASVFVPRVGPLTIAMATRNLTRLAMMRPDATR